MLIGATMNESDLDEYRKMLAGNNIMRIFPSDRTINGNAVKVLPAWTDSRFTYCQTAGVTPFVSTKVDGDAGGLAYVKQQLLAMPAWVRMLYITDRHEPEADVTASAYQANFNAFLAMVNTLPTALRARIRCGPILTRTWTESSAPGKGNFNYGTYDPGTGDFFGVDMYVESGTSSTVVAPATLPTAASFLQYLKAYKKTAGDLRPRVIPELGVIGMPGDLDGTGRAQWIASVYAELKTWTPAVNGWTFLGWIWWHATGKATGQVLTIGQRRDFPLHLRTVDENTVVVLPGTPPAPVAAFNAAWKAENTTPLPDDVVPGAKAMRAEYTLLVTDKNLNVLGDPIMNWQTIDLTLKFNEPGTGQFTVPGYNWIRAQVVSGNRITCIRRVLGVSKVILSGPIESIQYERSDDGENSATGMLTVTWADDLATLATRLTYPDPSKTPETQTTDFWVYKGNAEVGMLKLVNTQGGPGAQTARQIPKLTVAAVKGVGTTIEVSSTLGPARFVPVTDCLRDMAVRGGGLGFRTYQAMSSKTVVFEVYQPRDLSGPIRFGFDLGNLKYLGYELGAPEATVAIVGGQYDVDNVTAGADKYVTEVKNTTDLPVWGRAEEYLPRPGNDPQADLIQEGLKELGEKAETTRVSSTAADTIDQRYGVHYELGDKVSIQVFPGTAITDVVRMVHIQVFPTAGEVVNTQIGAQSTVYSSPTSNAYLRELTKAIYKRLVLLEARAVIHRRNEAATTVG
jgi:hypothetical protein